MRITEGEATSSSAERSGAYAQVLMAAWPQPVRVRKSNFAPPDHQVERISLCTIFIMSTKTGLLTPASTMRSTPRSMPSSWASRIRFILATSQMRPLPLQRRRRTTATPMDAQFAALQLTGGENMARDSHHIVPNPTGGWDVKRSGGQRSSGHWDTKAEAVNAGRQISRNQGTELVIHRRDGRIQGADSHGNDPFPPKG